MFSVLLMLMPALKGYLICFSTDGSAASLINARIIAGVDVNNEPNAKSLKVKCINRPLTRLRFPLLKKR